MKRYKDAFQDLRVPEDMLDRVLQSRKKKQARRRGYLGAAGAAACCAIAVGTAVLVPRLQGQQPQPPGSSHVQSGNPFQGAETLEELEGMRPFELNAPQCPEGFVFQSGAVLGGTLAQIQYSDGTILVTYRMGPGEEDVSGDYSQYPSREQRQEQGLLLTLSGQDGQIALVTWSREGYSYSLSFQPAVSEDSALEWVDACLI